MKKLILVLLSILSFSGFSQNEECAFSDNYFHYSVTLNIDNEPSNDFNKNDFIEHLEANSNLTNSEIIFLEQNLIDVFKAYYTPVSEPFNKMVYVTSLDSTLTTFFIPFSESITHSAIFCDCANSDGNYNNYAKFIVDGLLPYDINKADFINHLETTSNPTIEEIDFLNNTISEVYLAFPSTQIESLRKIVVVVSNYDLMLQYLFNFPESFSIVEILCGEPVLSINENQNLTLTDAIIVSPNPALENSQITIESQIFIEQLLVYNVTGELIIDRTINNKNITLNDIDLKAGFYFFKFNSKGKSIIKKIIIQ